MEMHHYLRLTFILLFVITALFCVYFIIRKKKKTPKLLSQEKYNSSMIGGMKEISISDSFFNIWPYVSKLKSAKVLSKKVKDNDLVYKIYRDSTEKFEHILLSTEDKNNFVTIIVNKKRKKTIGYSILDSDEKYELRSNIA